MKKRNILHWAMSVVMTPLLGSCAFDELHEIAGGGDNVLSFGVEVNAGAPEVKPMGGATRSGDRADSSATGSAVMSPDVDGFFPTSSVELSSVDGKTLYANCDERSGINMHNNVDYKITRGSIKSTNDFYDSFALYGYVYDSGKKWADANVGSSTNFDIDGITMSKNGTGSDYNASGVYWPGASKKATFFAVAPKDCSCASITANSGGPQITYTVLQEVSKQEDFLLAVAKDITCDGKHAPSLLFNHALAAIKFEKGTLTGYSSISKVEISGVNNKGTLSSFDNPAWTGQSIDGSTNTYSTSSLSDVMFLMPQTIPDGAKLKVTFSDGTNSKDFEADLKGTLWEAGHQYTYELSVNKVTGTFYFSVDNVNAAQNSTSATLKVSSYFQNDANNTKIPIKWSVSSYGAGATISSIDGSDTDISRNVTLSFSANTAASGQDATLRAKSEVGTEDNPVDLSIRTKDGNPYKETANCYVVNAPGYYKFPIVYGNGIVGGNFNSSAFNSPNYVTHDGRKMNTLDSPWISGVSSASLVWQDANGLIDNSISIIQDATDNNNNYISFYIPKSSIKQGNAVIAVKNNSKQIMWSWHIWVTAIDVYATQIVTSDFGTGGKFNFMPVPLGWCSSTKTYSVRVRQEGSNKSACGTVTQASPNGYIIGSCTYYQWGRKDPFPPSDGSSPNSNVMKTLYGYESNNPSWIKNNQTTNIQTSIQNPLTFYNAGAANWENTGALDLWNVGNSVTTLNYNTVTKSVYDPSPAGFRLPETAAFTGFSYDGVNSNPPNSSWDDLNKMWCFTTGIVNTYWHTCGYLHPDGWLGGVGERGQYWVSGPISDTGARYMYIDKNAVTPHDSNYRTHGLSVRPVSE